MSYASLRRRSAQTGRTRLCIRCWKPCETIIVSVPERLRYNHRPKAPAKTRRDNAPRIDGRSIHPGHADISRGPRFLYYFSVLSKSVKELFLHACRRERAAPDFRKASAKVRFLSEPPKLFASFFQKISIFMRKGGKTAGRRLPIHYYIIYRVGTAPLLSSTRGRDSQCGSPLKKVQRSMLNAQRKMTENAPFCAKP